MEAQDWSGAVHLWHKSRDAGLGENRGHPRSLWRQLGPGQGSPEAPGPGERPAPLSAPPRSVGSLRRRVCGLLWGPACCPGCCTLCFWKENRGSGGWWPCSAAHCLPRCRSGCVPSPDHSLISRPDSRFPAGFGPSEPLPIAASFPFPLSHPHITFRR